MIVSIQKWNEVVASMKIRVVGKKFWYKGEWYRYELLKGWVEIQKDVNKMEYRKRV